MDQDLIGGIRDAAMTVSDKIRALDAAGCSRAEIARHLGKRYQHVRNVLEADRLKAGAAPPGVQETSHPFAGRAGGLANEVEDRGEGAYRLIIRDDGTIALPDAVLKALGLRRGGAVMARLERDELRLVSGATALRRVQDLLRPYMQEGVSWADELIADRRREAAREDAGG